MDLSPLELRVLGCLMEKQITTPDQYPLTANSLRLACNQSTNRHPVVDYGEHDISSASTTLRDRGLTRVVYSPSNRAAKYRHIADEVLDLSSGAQAVLTVLALRGAQTVGELKTRTERMHAFDTLEAIDACLEALATRPDPLVVRLPRRPGQKEERFAHLLGGPIDLDAIGADESTPTSPRLDRVNDVTNRVDQLEQRVSELEAVIDQLRVLL